MLIRIEIINNSREKGASEICPGAKLWALKTAFLTSLQSKKVWKGSFCVKKMDWQGQKLSELLMQIMLVVSALVAFITGYIMSSFMNMLIIYAAGVIITLLTTVPDWPFFNRHPLQWLDPKEAEIHGIRHPKAKSQSQNANKKPTKASKK
eukprot:Gb_35765 [translate_table: standard]